MRGFLTLQNYVKNTIHNVKKMIHYDKHIIHEEEFMSYQERSSTVSIFTSLLIYAAYLFYVFIKFREGSVDMANDLRFWGIVILFALVGIYSRLGDILKGHVQNQ